MAWLQLTQIKLCLPVGREFSSLALGQESPLAGRLRESEAWTAADLSASWVVAKQTISVMSFIALTGRMAGRMLYLRWRGLLARDGPGNSIILSEPPQRSPRDLWQIVLGAQRDPFLTPIELERQARMSVCCPVCGGLVPPNQAAAFSGFHENCRSFSGKPGERPGGGRRFPVESQEILYHGSRFHSGEW